jgi:transcriptional antiterminator RfaH
MKAWHLIYCKPRQESLAKENLEQQGYTTYLPMTSVRRRKAGKRVIEASAMFPRYLFIQLSDDTEDWGSIRSTLGVSSLVRFGQIPAKVPEALILDLKAHEDESGLCVLVAPDFVEGDKVRIADGIFEGHEAIFICKNGLDRVSLLLEVLQKSTNIELDQEFIEKIT